MSVPDEDLSPCSALVVDSNHTSRAILIAQLRELGIRQITQCVRTSDARRQLEAQRFDFVLCEMHFADESTSGQELLDDLRRNQLLPFSTVFIMITGEATYARVAEAAESALDGYLLKPHKANQLSERLRVARVRKLELQPIFDAIDAQDFDGAANLCMERFTSRSLFWLYAARVGAELLLRLERYDDAQMLYQTVIEARTLPWAKLGIARAQLEAGQVSQATTTLEKLIGEDPQFVDAYDVMGRAQFELGQFEKALTTYRMASMLTPSSVTRVQNTGMMSYYAGHRAEAERMLSRTVRLGLESKMFDCQTLVLLAFVRLEKDDRRGLLLCQDDLLRLQDKQPDNNRLRRLGQFVHIAHLLMQRQADEVHGATAALARLARDSEFDFESASNIMALLAHMVRRQLPYHAADELVHTVAMRFCSNRSVTELLCASAALHPPYSETIRLAQGRILEVAENAVTMSMEGRAPAALQTLLEHGKKTLNVRLIDNALQLLQKHRARLDDPDTLHLAFTDLRRSAGAGNRKITLGNQRRLAGGLIIRTGGRPNKHRKA